MVVPLAASSVHGDAAIVSERPSAGKAQAIKANAALTYDRKDFEITGHFASARGFARPWYFFGRRFCVDAESSHSADELGRNFSRPTDVRRNEHEYLLCAHPHFALVGRLDAKFARCSANLDGPKVESQSIAITRGSGKVDCEVYRRCQNLFVMKQTRCARGEAIFEPVFDEIADHLKVARIEDPARGIAVSKPYKNLTLKCRHG
jgi:hypothetical protein